jgi:hypothetical protein
MKVIESWRVESWRSWGSSLEAVLENKAKSVAA